ncbi:MAG TPA: DUF2161 family putative PD-(D/E)XK-type phosphodiesterase [Candidatus Cloacimonadota bacterium]|nr:DUF2161 family putative PD-(D/E)XK-type phosphodiesterase [Candidatus Cloacimonadota bacterium]
MNETELFIPVKNFLEKQEFKVRAEVQNCDIAATRGDDLIIVELKLQVNIPLLIQATDRQKITDSVYVAIPRPGNRTQQKRWKGVKHLLRRLELGLIFVDVKSGEVEVVFHPLEFQRHKLQKRRKALLEEISNRSENLNTGGSNRRKIMTAYRLNALKIAQKLAELGQTSPKILRENGTGDKTLSILSSNFYGWFCRVERGIYELTSKGKTELQKYRSKHPDF